MISVGGIGAIKEILLILAALVPAFYIYRLLLRAIRPRDSAGRFFLFILANFLLVVIYTMTVATVIIRVFPPVKR